MADDTRKTPASKPSIASHRLFPLVVLLWFGALFGLASLAIRPVLLESVVAATGIDKVVPMAAPPLGNTARILIVLMMTVLGCLVGAVVARRLAKPAATQTAVRRRRAAPEAAPAMIEDASPVGLFGAAADRSDDEEEEDDQPVRRRRQLALLPDEETFEDHAPLPGQQILSVSELPLKSFDEVDEIWLHSSVRSPAPAPITDEAADSDAPPFNDHIDPEIASEEVPAPHSNPLLDSYARRVTASAGEPIEEPAPGFVSLTPPDAVEASTAPEPQIDPAYANTAERIATAPLDTLSHVELLERLALTIARRRAKAATAPAAAAAEPFTPAPPAVPLRPVSEMPAALRPHWIDQEDADDDALPASIPARSIAMKPVPTPVENAHVLADGYSSLLGMTRPAQDDSAPREFVRIDEPTDESLPQPPVFAFPGLQEVAATPIPERRAFDAPRTDEAMPDQTEQALRAALATLRRMSGTG